MATYRIIRGRGEIYSIVAELRSGRVIVTRETATKVWKPAVQSTVRGMAERLAAVRQAHKAVGDRTGIDGATG